MKKFIYQLGIDISKDHLDITLLENGQKKRHWQIANTPHAIQAYLRELNHQVCLSQTLFCMEHTGVYNAHLLKELVQQQCTVWLEVDATFRFVA